MPPSWPRCPAAPGAARWHSSSARAGGFTLLELLVVVTLIALATAGVSLALRDSAPAQLEREAQRLAALLESARAQSRVSGTPVLWRATAQGFRFEGLPPQALPTHWLDAATRAQTPVVLQLGPEPLIGPQGVTLLAGQANGQSWRVSTDGLRPFAAHALPAQAAPP